MTDRRMHERPQGAGCTSARREPDAAPRGYHAAVGSRVVTRRQAASYIFFDEELLMNTFFVVLPFSTAALPVRRPVPPPTLPPLLAF